MFRMGFCLNWIVYIFLLIFTEYCDIVLFMPKRPKSDNILKYT